VGEPAGRIGQADIGVDWAACWACAKRLPTLPVVDIGAEMSGEWAKLVAVGIGLANAVGTGTVGIIRPRKPDAGPGLTDLDGPATPCVGAVNVEGPETVIVTGTYGSAGCGLACDDQAYVIGDMAAGMGVLVL